MKKIVSILAIALLVAMLATAAFAAEENVITTDIIVNTVEAAAGFFNCLHIFFFCLFCL